MDELVAFALGATAVALFRPLRRRVIPVAKAVGRAGTGLVAVAVTATVDVVGAVVHPESQAKRSGGSETSG